MYRLPAWQPLNELARTGSNPIRSSSRPLGPWLILSAVLSAATSGPALAQAPAGRSQSPEVLLAKVQALLGAYEDGANQAGWRQLGDGAIPILECAQQTRRAA